MVKASFDVSGGDHHSVTTFSPAPLGFCHLGRAQLAAVTTPVAASTIYLPTASRSVFDTVGRRILRPILPTMIEPRGTGAGGPDHICTFAISASWSRALVAAVARRPCPPSPWTWMAAAAACRRIIRQIPSALHRPSLRACCETTGRLGGQRFPGRYGRDQPPPDAVVHSESCCPCRSRVGGGFRAAQAVVEQHRQERPVTLAKQGGGVGAVEQLLGLVIAQGRRVALVPVDLRALDPMYWVATGDGLDSSR